MSSEVPAETIIESGDELLSNPTVAEPVLEPINYKKIEITQGQYWAIHNQLVAFVVEVNQYAVIFQDRIDISEDEKTVFDFEGGQSLMTIDNFREYLEERRAEIVNPGESAVKAALVMYQSKLRNKEIKIPQMLPRDPDAYHNLRDKEVYATKKRIIPPPRKMRSRRGVHWLSVGAAGTQFSAKMWSPELDNWVFPDGTVDYSSKIGFVSGYHGLIAYLDDNNETLTFDEVLNKIVDMLRKKMFMFDENRIRSDLKLIQDKIKTSSIQPDNLDKFYPNYEIKLTQYQPVDKDGNLIQNGTTNLGIYLFYNNEQVHQVLYTGILNREFIPNQVPTVFTLELS